jgi:hypothetical protein
MKAAAADPVHSRASRYIEKPFKAKMAMKIKL